MKWRLTLLTVPLLLFVIGVFLLQPARVKAAPVPDFIPAGSMPADIKDYLLNCGYTNNAAAQIGWVSIAGQPASRTTTTTYGTAVVALQYNVAGIVCKTGSMGGLKSTNNGIISTSPNVPPLNGQTVSYSYGNYNGAYSVNSIVFNYGPPGGYVASNDYSITVTEKRIHTYLVNPKYRCVENPGFTSYRQPTSNIDFAACRSVGVPIFDFHVDVTGRVPNPRLVARCDATGVLTVAFHNAADPDGGNVTATITLPVGAPSQSGPGNDFTFTFAGQPRDGVVKTASGYVVDAQTGERIVRTTTYACAAPPPTVVCTIVPVSGDLEPGDSYSFQLFISHTGPHYSPTINETAQLVVNGQTRTQAGIVLSQGGSTTITFAPPVSFPIAGVYALNGTLIGTLSARCGGVQSVRVATKPYVRVYGGEVVAGASFTCSNVPIKSDILTYNRQVGANWIGAGSQFGSYANGSIVSFATALLFAASAPSTLAFANVNTTPPVNLGANPPIMGGSFGSPFCAPGLWPKALPRLTPGAVQTLDGNTAGQLQFAGNVTLRQTAPLAHSTVIYVNGNLTISQNLLTTTSWATINDIPNLYIIVNGGNIYIDPAVTEIDGVFVAQPTTDKNGRIYTCYSAPGIDSLFIATRCGNKLTVNGALRAAKVNFTRVRGTVRLGVPAETPTNCNLNLPNCNIAETIQFSPELLLGIPALDRTNAGYQLDSIVSLSPSL